ncbi:MULTISPECIES: beta-ketoacyl-[acyl-carrier-protein] synthase family protein [Mesorhizobium]|uniref:beta-ketoacyl-[acyl-carrier-protein] synthase family protein n=1 Tax=Mesorhizobium TaxID=68287 RepID=UPI0007EDCE6B|nr:MULTISPECIES: beta-ketoacyl-[acyl-carrier-protein] synthase family protein [Mesorhizobium]TPJ43729.1 beta-ketoacyl-[acyl-carrier-protein] synthase family protein [Mesorhizobium sp. B2-6-6]ARP67354.1 beta-ACP synthase [Mesorhizobium sp. WSM1497]MCA0002914.1 beta-ketoacyl-[acyl-carrier-protein] synthase family protein [Mesorhizobium sp. B264B2A]MCA0009200.1 beta-ketoacyl-[acyl-carrier-protein] synthase family protein [Mesorhizobium sp. B264B1B]MCA0013999.1 beta-ketoacyl-[acyl-carrier-protein]
MDRRVVITGLGGLCGLGTDVGSIWKGMREGRSAIGPIVNAQLHGLEGAIGAEIKTLPEHDIEPRQLLSMGRFSLLAVLAAREAMRQSGLSCDEGNAHRFGAIVGAGFGGFDATEKGYRDVLLGGASRVELFSGVKAMPSAAACQVSMSLGLRGPVFAVTTACASGNHAIASAVDQIKYGRADVMLAGGSDAAFVYMMMKAWEAMRVLAPDTCRPFSADRKGVVLGEGAGMAVLESYEHATARGAKILAEVAGIGLSADASHIAAPAVHGPEGAMRACLADAKLNPEDVEYLNAHGTGTKANDQIETAAIKRVFGEHAHSMSVSSTKSTHGHCLGAASAIEMIACVMAIQEGVVPPTANYREPDPDCDLDVTPNVPRERKVRVAMSNAFAMGGTNAVLAFKHV